MTNLFQALENFCKDSPEPSWLQDKNSLSLSLHEMLQFSDYFHGLLWTFSNRPSHAENPGAGCSTLGGISGDLSSSRESPPSTCCPHCFWGFLCCNCTFPVDGGCFLSTSIPSLSLHGCSQTILCSPNILGGFSWPMCRTLHLDLSNSMRLHWPTSQACQSPSGWHPFPPTCQFYHTA